MTKVKKSSLFQIHRGFFTEEEQETFLFHPTWIDWKPCPKWLGNFKFRIYGNVGTRCYGDLPAELQSLANKMSQLVPGQIFTTYSTHKYEKGRSVKPHRDPKSNTGYAVAAIFGDFKGAGTILEKSRFKLRPGDVLIQRCTVANRKRPLHRTTPVTAGTRYALIINTIKQEVKDG